MDTLETISFEDFTKISLNIGLIESAERIDGSPKLLRLTVNFGEAVPRQVISGIARQFVVDGEITGLIGKKFVFITNLPPRKIMELESQAMILASVDENGLGLMSPTCDLKPGTRLS